MKQTASQHHAIEPDFQLSCSADQAILPPQPRARQARTGLLWLLVLGMLAGMLATGWWLEQRNRELASQLVATQQTFARISESASSELQGISAQLGDRNSQVSSQQARLEQQLLQLQEKLDQLSATLQQQDTRLEQQQAAQQQLLQQLGQLQSGSARQQEQQSALDSNLQALQAAQQDASVRLDSLQQREDPQLRIEQLGSELASLQRRLQTQDELAAQLQSLTLAQAISKEQLDSMARQDQLQAIEGQLQALRSQLEQRPPAGVSQHDFDSFRQQTTRHITTLQEQWLNLQRQSR